jgi:hypothetical protein
MNSTDGDWAELDHFAWAAEGRPTGADICHDMPAPNLDTDIPARLAGSVHCVRPEMGRPPASQRYERHKPSAGRILTRPE